MNAQNEDDAPSTSKRLDRRESLARLEASVVAARAAIQTSTEAQKALLEASETRIDNLAGFVRALGDAIVPKLETSLRLLEKVDSDVARLEKRVWKIDAEVTLAINAIRGLAEQLVGRDRVAPALALAQSRRPKKGKRR